MRTRQLQRVETPGDPIGVRNTTETLEQKKTTSWTSMGQEADKCVTHKAVRTGARPHVPPVMAEGDFRLMTPLYDNLQ